MRNYSCRWALGTLLVAVGLVTLGVAQDKTLPVSEGAVRPPPALSAEGPGEPGALPLPPLSLPGAGSPASLTAEYQDPAFEQYVDLRLLGEAWDRLDSALLCDVALQLAEGERVLLRPHKTLSSNHLLEVAVRLAAEKNDQPTLVRLARAAAVHGSKDLAVRIEAARKLAGESRRPELTLLVPLDGLTPERLEVLQHHTRVLQAARITGDKESLGKLEKGLGERTGLTDAQRQHLQRLVTETRSATTGTRAEAADVLNQLADSSRGTWRGPVLRYVTIKPGVKAGLYYEPRTSGHELGTAEHGVLLAVWYVTKGGWLWVTWVPSDSHVRIKPNYMGWWTGWVREPITQAYSSR